jgi:SAM-dependent methyltransferase
MTDDDHAVSVPVGTDVQALRARMAGHRWTAHNLQLAPGVWTLPDTPGFVETDSRLGAILRLCRAIYGERLGAVRALDLGCLEGGFSAGLALAGADVLGVEARQDHFEKCLLARDALALPTLAFVREDVKKVTAERCGRFDVVLALGILYHLDDPVGWLQQIASLTRGLLFVDTHYAPKDEAGLAGVRIGLRQRLSSVERMESHGLEVAGQWFGEWPTESERDARPWASWSNPRSLWLTKESLVRAVAHAGFDTVVEQYDYWLKRYEVFTTEYPRTMLVGLKSAELAAGARKRV